MSYEKKINKIFSKVCAIMQCARSAKFPGFSSVSCGFEYCFSSDVAVT